MNKKILLISSDYNSLYFKVTIYNLKKKFNNLHICIANFLILKKIKMIFFLFLMLNIKEFFFLIIRTIKLIFNKKINYKYYKISNINSESFINYVKKNKFKIIVLYNCSQIFLKKTLDRINCKVINFHFGITRNHRGLFSVYYAIKNKEKSIGITCHKVDKKIDAGDIISEFKIPRKEIENIGLLYRRIFLSKKLFMFITKIIEKLNKNNMFEYKKNFNSKYYSYPPLTDLIKFRLRSLIKYKF